MFAQKTRSLFAGWVDAPGWWGVGGCGGVRRDGRMGTFALPWSRQKLISALMTAAATSRRRPSEWQASLAGSVAASVFVRHLGARC